MHLTTIGTGSALVMLLIAGNLASAKLSASNGSALRVIKTSAAKQPVKHTSSFVSPNFNVPTVVETEKFKVVPLGPELVKVDFDAYMSSIEHLQKTFTRSADWPRKGITETDAMKDMEEEQTRFKTRASFAYSVLTKDGRRERGCVYIYPSQVKGYDAVVRLWVTSAEYDAGFDAHLFEWVKTWMQKDWPFANIAYPGRSIAWDRWDTLEAASRAQKAAM